MKKSLFPVVVITALLALALAEAGTAPSEQTAEVAVKKKKQTPLPAGVEVQRDLVFKNPEDEGDPLRLDLYQPSEAEGDLPVVVWVHGGGWLNGSKDNCKANWLAQHGFAVASIQYRLTDRAIWPAQIDDCRDAVAWLREHAGKYGLDVENFGAWGGSAGGHLVALMGTMPYPKGKETGRVSAVCDWYGPTQLLTMPPNMVANGRTEEQVAKSNGAKLLGVTVKDAQDKARDASAIDHVSPDDAAFLIMHGSEDPGVPLVQSSSFHQKLRGMGVDSRFEIVEGAGHGGKEFQSDEVRNVVLQFFEKHLK